MRKLLGPALVLKLSVLVPIGIVTHFIIGITFNLTQILIALVFAFLNDSQITTSCWGIKGLVFFVSSTKTRVFFCKADPSID